MSNFKIGEKVVCVDETPNGSSKGLVKNEIYTIQDICIDVCDEVGLILFELKSNHYKGSWAAKRFRKLDHQFGEDVCAEILKKVKEESLISVN